MTADRKAKIITVAVLAAALAVALGRKSGWKFPAWSASSPFPAKAAAKPDSTPQDAVYAMLDAARVGDVKSYLAGYTGQMQASLRQALVESTEAAMAKYLIESNAVIKGIAISEPQNLNQREVKLRVEYVYQDRNEAQYMYLEKGSSGWKIARVDGIERVKTLVPYGTPVQ